jgi:hypothetical protein
MARRDGDLRKESRDAVYAAAAASVLVVAGCYGSGPVTPPPQRRPYGRALRSVLTLVGDEPSCGVPTRVVVIDPGA